MFGLPSIWGQTPLIEGLYKSYTWSPCGRSFSTLSPTSVEVWDALTLEKRTILQPGSVIPLQPRVGYSPEALAYSPDGCSLAGVLGSGITIWDIKTGGVVEEIKFKIANRVPSLVWSPDGTMVYATFHLNGRTWTTVTYDIASRKEASINILSSFNKPHLWLHNASPWVMTMMDNEGSQVIINILEIQPNSINNLVESFSIEFDLCNRVLFSPSTYHVSTVTGGGVLFALDIHNSRVLLQEEGYDANCGASFSPDGSLMTASNPQSGIHVWRYIPVQGYILWRKLPFQSMFIPCGHQFSPCLSSMLTFTKDHLEVRYLEGPTTDPSMARIFSSQVRFSDNGTYVVTVASSGSIFIITNLREGSSQCIDMKFKIRGLAITDNILLVMGKSVITGWQLATEGTVGKLFSNRGEGHDGRLWTKPAPPSKFVYFWTNYHIASIKGPDHSVYFYNTETGEGLEPVLGRVPPSYPPSPILLTDSSSWSNPSLKDVVDSPLQLQEGWVKCPIGEHQHWFWLPPHRRLYWQESFWIEDATTLVLTIVGDPQVIIKL